MNKIFTHKTKRPKFTPNLHQNLIKFTAGTVGWACGVADIGRGYEAGMIVRTLCPLQLRSTRVFGSDNIDAIVTNAVLFI